MVGDRPIDLEPSLKDNDRTSNYNPARLANDTLMDESTGRLQQVPDSSSEDEESPVLNNQYVARPSTSTSTSASASNGPTTAGPVQHKRKRPRPCDYCRFRKVREVSLSPWSVPSRLANAPPASPSVWSGRPQTRCDKPDTEKGDKAGCSLCIKSNVVCAYVEPSKRRRTSSKDTGTKVSSVLSMRGAKRLAELTSFVFVLFAALNLPLHRAGDLLFVKADSLAKGSYGRGRL